MSRTHAIFPIMTRARRLIFLSRLFFAFAVLALGGELAAPAFATALSAGRDMPCHEQMTMPVHAPNEVANGAHHHGTAPQPAIGHLCCTLACLVVAPAGEGPLVAPVRRLAAWDGAAAFPLLGRAPPIPVPPPRAVS